MGSRLELQTLLETLLGSTNVYFQAPPSVKMSYPCIVFSRTDIRPDFADNAPYKLTKKYTVTVIDANPDSQLPDKVAKLPMCIFDRAFATENLNHSVFNLSY